MVDYAGAADYTNLPRCRITGCSVGRIWRGVHYPHHLRYNSANQTPKGLLAPLFVKKMAIGIPFCDKKVQASLFVKKSGMASLFVKKT